MPAWIAAYTATGFTKNTVRVRQSGHSREKCGRPAAGNRNRMAAGASGWAMADATSVGRAAAIGRGSPELWRSWAVRAGDLVWPNQAQAFLPDFRHEMGGVLQLALRLFPVDGYLGAVIAPCPEIEGPPEPFREILREQVGVNV